MVTFSLGPLNGLPPRHRSRTAAREGRQRRYQGQPREFDCVNSALCGYETSRRPRTARVRLPMATSAVRTSVAAGTSVTAGREGRVASPLPMPANTLASLSSTESRPSWVMQAQKKRALLRARRDLQTSANFVRWLSWPNAASGTDLTASQSKCAPEIGRRRASYPGCSSTQPAADHVLPYRLRSMSARCC